MKTFTLLSIFIICCIQHILAYPQNKLPAGTIIVAQDGSGNFRTLQSAIDSLSNSASSERVIYIKNGTYREQILCQKKYVTLVGENKDKVILTYDLNNAKTGSSSKCASFRAYGDNFKAFDITFENTAPFPGNNAQAPAFYSYGDRHYIENCNFLSYQDTLLSYHGFQYFKNCYIRGLTDFIWGFGRAVFDQCTLHVVSKGGKNEGYLTANGNEDPNFREGGFLITNSKVISDGARFYLGRLWKKNCYVIFDKTNFPGDKIVKEGWLTFNGYDNYKNTSKVGEYQCSGNGYNMNGRVSWSTRFNSVPSISEFLGGDLSFASSIAYNEYNNNNNDNGYDNNYTTVIKTTTTKRIHTTTTKKTHTTTTKRTNTTTTKRTNTTTTKRTHITTTKRTNTTTTKRTNTTTTKRTHTSTTKKSTNKITTTKRTNPTTNNNWNDWNNGNEGDNNKNCSKLYYQCGGKNYKGPTCCSFGECKKMNEYFSMCA